MKWLKSFIAGIIVPTIILPICTLIFLYIGKKEILTIPFLHFIPIIWGFWNMFYFAFLKNVLSDNQNTRLYTTGAILGFLVAIYGVFWFDVPTLIGLPEQIRYLPIIVAPIVYALLWRFLVKDLNHILYLKD
jgi:uncharacterized membrane protein